MFSCFPSAKARARRKGIAWLNFPKIERDPGARMKKKIAKATKAFDKVCALRGINNTLRVLVSLSCVGPLAAKRKPSEWMPPRPCREYLQPSLRARINSRSRAQQRHRSFFQAGSNSKDLVGGMGCDQLPPKYGSIRPSVALEPKGNLERSGGPWLFHRRCQPHRNDSPLLRLCPAASRIHAQRWPERRTFLAPE